VLGYGPGHRDTFSALSLNAPAGDEGDSEELGDLIGLEDAAVEHAVDMEAVAQHWDELPHREQQILSLYRE
jgi:DNA-directed RNA polymerase specialized sigma subunit